MKLFNQSVLSNALHILLMVVFALFNITAYSQPTKIEPLFNCTNVLENQYGITSHITWQGYDYDRYKECLDLIKKPGIGILRTDFNYTGVNWGGDKVDFTIWDNVNSAAKLRGVQLLPIIYYKTYHNYSAVYSKVFKDFVSTCVRRYGGNMAGWEIWNETDQMFEQDGVVPPEEYVPLLKDAFQTIKAIDSKTPVLLGAMCDPSKEYFKTLLAHDVVNYCDILSMHYYSAKDVPEKIIPFYYKLAGLLNDYSVKKTIWLTESGYKTYSDNTDPELFYTEVLPKVYKSLGIKRSKVTLGILYDDRIKRCLVNQDNNNVYYGFKSCKLVKLSDLKDLSPKDCPVLMLLFGERFPKESFSDLKAYLKRGGTVVLPEGGAPFYYEWELNTDDIVAVGDKYYKQLHIGCLYSWDEKAKALGIKKMTNVFSVWDKTLSYSWHDNSLASPKYLTKDNMQMGDSFISLMEGTDGTNNGTVAVCYKFNSDLNGNLIIQTRSHTSEMVSQALQASRMPRVYLLSYAMGVDKVFTYCLRDRIDSQGYGVLSPTLGEKPVYNTMAAMMKWLPEGSTRPVIQFSHHQYIASWQTPKGEKIYCVWSDIIGVAPKVRIKGSSRLYDEYGRRIKKRKFRITPNVTYIKGASSVTFD